MTKPRPSKYQSRTQAATRSAYPRRVDQGLPRRDRGETQRALVEYVVDYKRAHDGNSPSYSLMAEALGIGVPTAYMTAMRLVAKGILSLNADRKLIVGRGGEYTPPKDFLPEEW